MRRHQNPHKSLIEQVVREAGGLKAVAARISESTRIRVTPQRLCNWFERGVPASFGMALIAATDGKLKGSHIRPNDWWLIWPDLPGAKTARRAAANETKQAA